MCIRDRNRPRMGFSFRTFSHTCLSVVPEIRPRTGSVFWDDGRMISVDDLLSPWTDNARSWNSGPLVIRACPLSQKLDPVWGLFSGMMDGRLALTVCCHHDATMNTTTIRAHPTYMCNTTISLLLKKRNKHRSGENNQKQEKQQRTRRTVVIDGSEQVHNNKSRNNKPRPVP